MLEEFGLISKVLCYVKDEDTNLVSMTLIISCEALSLLVPFDGACFGHVMSKANQRATNDYKISKDLAPINVKSTQVLFNLASHGKKIQVYYNLEFNDVSICKL
jgi:hypothetical protein